MRQNADDTTALVIYRMSPVQALLSILNPVSKSALLTPQALQVNTEDMATCHCRFSSKVSPPVQCEVSSFLGTLSRLARIMKAEEENDAVLLFDAIEQAAEVSDAAQAEG